MALTGPLGRTAENIKSKFQQHIIVLHLEVKNEMEIGLFSDADTAFSSYCVVTFMHTYMSIN